MAKKWRFCALKCNYILNKWRAGGIWKKTSVFGTRVVVQNKAIHSKVLIMWGTARTDVVLSLENQHGGGNREREWGEDGILPLLLYSLFNILEFLGGNHRKFKFRTFSDRRSLVGNKWCVVSIFNFVARGEHPAGSLRDSPTTQMAHECITFTIFCILQTDAIGPFLDRAVTTMTRNLQRSGKRSGPLVRCNMEGSYFVLIGFRDDLVHSLLSEFYTQSC